MFLLRWTKHFVEISECSQLSLTLKQALKVSSFFFWQAYTLAKRMYELLRRREKTDIPESMHFPPVNRGTEMSYVRRFWGEIYKTKKSYSREHAGWCVSYLYKFVGNSLKRASIDEAPMSGCCVTVQYG